MNGVPFTKEPRIFECYLARGTRDPLSYSGQPRTRVEHFELSRSNARVLASNLPGIPMVGEHDTTVKIGRVMNTHVHDNSGDFACRFQLDTHQSKAALVAASMIDVGYIRGVSLCHNRHTMQGKEVSLCFKGARPGTEIYSGQQVADETNIQLSNLGKDQWLSNRDVRASSLSDIHYIGSEWVIAHSAEILGEARNNNVMASESTPMETKGDVSPPSSAAAAAPVNPVANYAAQLTNQMMQGMQQQQQAMSPPPQQQEPQKLTTPLAPPPQATPPVAPPATTTTVASPPSQPPNITPENAAGYLAQMAVGIADSGDDKRYPEFQATKEVLTQLSTLSKEKEALTAKAAEQATKLAEESAKVKELDAAKARIQELEALMIQQKLMKGVAAGTDHREYQRMQQGIQSGKLDRAAQSYHDSEQRRSVGRPPKGPGTGAAAPIPEQQSPRNSFFKNDSDRVGFDFLRAMSSYVNGGRAQPGPTPQHILNPQPVAVAASSLSSSPYHTMQHLSSLPPPTPLLSTVAASRGSELKQDDDEDGLVRATNVKGDMCQASNEGFSKYHKDLWLGRRSFVNDPVRAKIDDTYIEAMIRASGLSQSLLGDGKVGGSNQARYDIYGADFSRPAPLITESSEGIRQQGWGYQPLQSSTPSYGRESGTIMTTRAGGHLHIPPMHVFPPNVHASLLEALGSTPNGRTRIEVVEYMDPLLPDRARIKAAGPTRTWPRYNQSQFFY